MIYERAAQTHELAAATDAPSFCELADRFRPLFDRIEADAVRRESARELPYEPVELLRRAGFGAVRIPRRFGGLGATLPQLFRLLVELATADSNLAHLFRGHLAFVEERLNAQDPATQDYWFPKVVSGALIGYAMSERIAVTGNETTLTRRADHWILEGKKFYSTGTIYADWIVASAAEGENFCTVGIPSDTPGVTRLDDWDGFGQRLTGSGTTIFERVRVEPEHIVRRFDPQRRKKSYHLAFLQLVLLATLAGIGRAALRDASEFVRSRTRGFGIPGASSPRSDPLVQRVIGRLSSLSFAADSMVDGVAHALETVHRAHLAGNAEEADFTAVDIQAFQAQQIVIDHILAATTLLFEVGGASATSESRSFDRHWRNARTVASHNPAIYRERAIGDYVLNGKTPETYWVVAQKAESSSGDTRTDSRPIAAETPVSS
jgi:alkylation response protein AidB-like acyl-CoA dehydrogenase